MKRLFLLGILAVGAVYAQSNNANPFSPPITAGSAPNAKCNNGEQFYNINTYIWYACGPSNTWTPIGGQVGVCKIATNSTVGCVKPDGTTITIDINGTISAMSSSSASPQHYKYSGNCQGTLAGTNFSWPASNGQASGTNYIPICDSAGGSVDSYVPMTTQGTTVLWMGPILLDSSFNDPIAVNLQWNTTATTGTFIPTIGAQCLSSGGLVSSSGFATSGTGFSAFVSSTANGTASHVTFAPTLSLTTGCTSGQDAYFQFSWPSTGGGTVASANVKVIDIQLK